MIKAERENEILELLKTHTFATVDFLAEKIHISASSIRRDLDDLEVRGLVRRTYGGVTLRREGGKIAPFRLRSRQNEREKKAIAALAASLVEPDDVIFIDGATTTYYMAPHLAKIPNITVITNSIELITALADYDMRVCCTGGNVSAVNHSVFCGPAAERMVGEIHADKMFFASETISRDGKIEVLYEEEGNLRRKMMENCTEIIFLCDSTKFDRHSTYCVCHARDIDVMVCDRAPGAFLAEENAPKKIMVATGRKKE